MPDEQWIYQHQPELYERLISCEDYQQNIVKSLHQTVRLEGADVVELGAGTGRLTCMLAPLVRRIRAFDVAQPMLDVAIAKLRKSGLNNWQVQVADHRRVPVEDDWADLLISGWSVCYLVKGDPEEWQEELSQVLIEMKRIVRTGGTIVLLETQGTGFESPHAPDHLVPYYAFLEGAGFSSTWIRTDYRFETLQEAESSVRFFFGEELAKQVVEQNWLVLPECTGIWWSKVHKEMRLNSVV